MNTETLQLQAESLQMPKIYYFRLNIVFLLISDVPIPISFSGANTRIKY